MVEKTRHSTHATPEEHKKHGKARKEHHDHHAHMVADFKKRFWVSLILTVPILVLSPMLQEWFGLEDSLRFFGDLLILSVLSTTLFFYGGRPFLKGMVDELRSRNPGMMTLIALAISVAYFYSGAVVFGLEGKIFFWELATLVDVMLLGHWVEMKSVMGASRALQELARLMPPDAHKIFSDGSVKDVLLGKLVAGDRVLVKPGEKIPSDGVVVDGETWVDEALLTGESKPVLKAVGAQVVGGSINAEGSIKIEIKKTGKDSFVSQVIKLVREAQESKSKTQNLADHAARLLTITAIVVGTITFFVWLILVNRDFSFSLERTVTVMVITCPHALGLAIPLVVAASTALAAKSGLLIRNRVAFEGARNIQAVIFDKTGTLTEGKFGVTDILVFGADDKDELLKYAASIEAHSEHSIARAIFKSSNEVLPVEGFKAITGKGVEGTVNGNEVKVVSPGYLKEQDVPIDNERVKEFSSQGKTVVYVIINGVLKGAIALADTIRPESKRAISMLKKMGIRCVMLTGDNKQVAKWVSEEVGLDEYFAEVLPHEKVEKINEVQSRGLVVAMTGDGVNDAPALAQADIGIAIGAGTDVAVETADIILVRSNPLDVVSIIGLARATYRKMFQNLAWATGYNIVAIPLAAGVFYNQGVLLSPAVGAIFMSLSTIIVAINARFLRFVG